MKRDCKVAGFRFGGDGILIKNPNLFLCDKKGSVTASGYEV